MCVCFEKMERGGRDAAVSGNVPAAVFLPS